MRDLGEERSAQRLVVGVEQVIERVLDVLGGHLLAVVEGDIVAQLERIGLLVGGDRRQGLWRVAASGTPSASYSTRFSNTVWPEDHRVVIELINRVDRDRVARQDDGQCLAIGSAGHRASWRAAARRARRRAPAASNSRRFIGRLGHRNIPLNDNALTARIVISHRTDPELTSRFRQRRKIRTLGHLIWHLLSCWLCATRSARLRLSIGSPGSAASAPRHRISTCRNRRVSLRIKGLERILGANLFDRSLYRPMHTTLGARYLCRCRADCSPMPSRSSARSGKA